MDAGFTLKSLNRSQTRKNQLPRQSLAVLQEKNQAALRRADHAITVGYCPCTVSVYSGAPKWPHISSYKY